MILFSVLAAVQNQIGPELAGALAPIRFTPQAIATNPADLVCLMATAAGAQIGLRLASALPTRAMIVVALMLAAASGVGAALTPR